MQAFSDIGIGKDEREINTFYDKIRHYLDDLELKSEGEKTINDALRETFKEDELYGLISKEEFKHILDCYEEQQESEELKNEAIKCKEVLGHNFARLLYSKPGFHHLGSTSYLVEDLNINDIHRNSFLNGHTSYRLNDEESLQHIQNHHNQIAIMSHLTVANKYLDLNETQKAKEEIDKALGLNPKCGDSIGTLARLQGIEKKFKDAYQNFQIALKSKPINVGEIKRQFSEALSQDGIIEYHKNEFKKAFSLLEKSLALNSTNAGAILHRELCVQQLYAKKNFGKSEHNYRE